MLKDTAVVCDRCLKEKRPIKYAMGGKEGPQGTEYFRVPIGSLQDPEIYWPDLPPGTSEN